MLFLIDPYILDFNKRFAKWISFAKDQFIESHFKSNRNEFSDYYYYYHSVSDICQSTDICEFVDHPGILYYEYPGIAFYAKLGRNGRSDGQLLAYRKLFNGTSKMRKMIIEKNDENELRLRIGEEVELNPWLVTSSTSSMTKDCGTVPYSITIGVTLSMDTYIAMMWLMDATPPIRVCYMAEHTYSSTNMMSCTVKASTILYYWLIIEINITTSGKLLTTESINCNKYLRVVDYGIVIMSIIYTMKSWSTPNI